VVFFFNDTCPYCLKSLPMDVETSQRLREEFGDAVSMLGVCACDAIEARDYARKHGLNFPVVAIRDKRTIVLFRAQTVPLLLVIDREGRVREFIQGVIETREQVETIMTAVRAKDSTPMRPQQRSEL
jgi:peroxiredoxin